LTINLTAYEQDFPYDSDEASFIRLTRRNCNLASKVLTEFEARTSLILIIKLNVIRFEQLHASKITLH